jgi:hypothetical protein
MNSLRSFGIVCGILQIATNNVVKLHSDRVDFSVTRRGKQPALNVLGTNGRQTTLE